MSVPTPTNQSLFTGNGVTTVFNAGFYFLDDDEVVVRITPLGGVEVIKTKGVHYNVTMPAGVGLNGSITMLVAPAANDAIVIERTVPLTQVMSLRQQGSFSPAIHEDAFDESVFRDQQLARRVSALESAGAAGSVVAGNGLAFIATTLHVGAGTGIQANADTIEVLFGEAADIAVAYDGSTGAGVLDKAARADHHHGIPWVDSPTDIAVGAANSAGAGGALARADHVHGLAAPAAPANVTKAAASAGAATTVARADHKHDVSTAAAVSLTDAANAEGAATSLARSDHTHAHGNRGGGALHALAVSGGAAGFQSGADKAILDALAASRPRVRANQVVAQAIPNAVDTQVVFEVEEYDTSLAYNPITGLFTVPAGQGGYYSIAAMLHFAATAFAGASSVASFVRVNGSPVVQGGFSEEPAAGTFRPGLTLATTLLLVAGDTVAISVYSTGGVARNTYGDNSYAVGVQGSCSLAIDKLN